MVDYMCKLKMVSETIWNRIRTSYSKLISTNDIKQYNSGIKILSIRGFMMKLISLYKSNFIYKKDFIDELHHPAHCCKNLIEGKLHDDCDGWCSAVYHIIHENGFKCYIVTTIYTDGGHCFILFKYIDGYYIIDYTDIQGSFSNIKQVEDYIINKKYKDTHLFHNYLIYDYKNNKYIEVKPK